MKKTNEILKSIGFSDSLINAIQQADCTNNEIEIPRLGIPDVTFISVNVDPLTIESPAPQNLFISSNLPF